LLLADPTEGRAQHGSERSGESIFLAGDSIVTVVF